MRKLDLSDYQATQTFATGSGETAELTAPYIVKDSVVNILFLPGLGLKGIELIRQNKLAVKIEAADGEVFLEEEEYQRVKAAAENYPAPGRIHVELIDRILNKTPEIEVKN